MCKQRIRNSLARLRSRMPWTQARMHQSQATMYRILFEASVREEHRLQKWHKEDTATIQRLQQELKTALEGPKTTRVHMRYSLVKAAQEMFVTDWHRMVKGQDLRLGLSEYLTLWQKSRKGDYEEVNEPLTDDHLVTFIL